MATPLPFLLDPSSREALRVKALGGLGDVAQTVRSAGFQDVLAGLQPESREEAVLRQGQRGRASLESQLTLAGRAAGGGGDIARLDFEQGLLNQLLGFRPERIARGGRGTVPGPEPEVKPLPPTTQPPFRVLGAPKPEPPPRAETPAFIRDLQKALDARRTAERDIGERQAALRTLPPQLGESPEALARRIGGPLEFGSPEQAFTATLLGERRKRSERDTADEALAQRALRAFAAGDEATSARLYEQLAGRTVSNMRLRSKKANATMSAHLDGTARTIMRFLGESEDATTRNAMIAQTPPKILEAAKQMAIRGASSKEVEDFLAANSPQVQQRRQQTFERKKQAFQESQSKALFGIIGALIQARSGGTQGGGGGFTQVPTRGQVRTG